jgi:predicted nuclease of predicted toxin-antitoxin system
MRAVVDECTGSVIARCLESFGHDVISISDEYPGLPDERVLELAVQLDRLLITNDKDFGEMVFRERRLHRGVILLRLPDDRVRTKMAALERLLAILPDDASSCFIVVTERGVCIRRGDD